MTTFQRSGAGDSGNSSFPCQGCILDARSAQESVGGFFFGCHLCGGLGEDVFKGVFFKGPSRKESTHSRAAAGSCCAQRWTIEATARFWAGPESMASLRMRALRPPRLDVSNAQWGGILTGFSKYGRRATNECLQVRLASMWARRAAAFSRSSGALAIASSRVMGALTREAMPSK